MKKLLNITDDELRFYSSLLLVAAMAAVLTLLIIQNPIK